MTTLGAIILSATIAVVALVLFLRRKQKPLPPSTSTLPKPETKEEYDLRRREEMKKIREAWDKKTPDERAKELQDLLNGEGKDNVK